MRILAAAGLALAVSTGAAADGLKGYDHAPIWTGLYIGAQGGKIAGSANGTLGYDDAAFPGVTAADIFDSTKRNFDVKGTTAGLFAGYNWQSGNVVFGIEGDMSWVDADGTTTATTADTFTTWNMSSKLYSLGTLRGRLGLALGTLHLYGTAGLGWGLIESNNAVSCVGCPVDPWATGSSKKSHFGLSAGGGAEWLITPNIIFRADYLYTDLGSVKHTFVGTALSGLPADETSPGSGVYHYKSDSLKQDLQFHTFRAGIGFKF